MTGVSKAGTKGVPRAERERQILDMAVEEIGRVGYAGLSPGEVAVRAGVSKPLVYAYFETKDGLYAACVRRAGAILGDAIEEVLDESTGMPAVGRTLDAIFTALEPRPQDWNVLFDRTHPAEGPSAEALDEARNRIAQQAARGVSAVLAAAGNNDPADLSALTDVWTGVVTSLVDWWLRHPEQSAKAMSERSQRLLDAVTLPPP